MIFIIDNTYKIIGAILLSCFVAYLRWRIILKQRRIVAADEFRKIIITEFSELYPDGIFHIKAGSDITKIIREKHNIINTAVISYRQHVMDKIGFDKAWDNFTGIDRFRDKDEKPRYNQYSFKNIQGTHFYENPKEMFIKNLERLLKFTE